MATAVAMPAGYSIFSKALKTALIASLMLEKSRARAKRPMARAVAASSLPSTAQ